MPSFGHPKSLPFPENRTVVPSRPVRGNPCDGGRRAAAETSRELMTFVVFDDSAMQQSQPQQQVASVGLKPLDDKENLVSAKSARERERAEHEHNIERGELRCTPTEQLDRWIEYIKWSQRSICSKQEVVGLLERCTKTFKADRRLRSQRKYLRVWINYADMCSDKEGVFEFMWSEKIGVTHALYFEAVSAMHETGEGTLEGEPNLHRAAKMLAVGIKMQADPVERLQARKKELKRRTLRKLQKEKAKRAQLMQPMPEEPEADEAEEAEPDTAAPEVPQQPAPGEPEVAPETEALHPEPEPEQQAEQQAELAVVVPVAAEPVQAVDPTPPKVFDVACDSCDIECSEASWRLEAADEDMCVPCYTKRLKGSAKDQASILDAVRQKDGQDMVAVEAVTKEKTVVAKKSTKERKPLQPKKLKTKVLPLATVAPNKKKEPAAAAAKKSLENVEVVAATAAEPPADETGGEEPWVGTKQAKARRRKKLYKPTFDGDAPAAEDGGFSLFTDKNGRDCR